MMYKGFLWKKKSIFTTIEKKNCSINFLKTIKYWIEQDKNVKFYINNLMKLRGPSRSVEVEKPKKKRERE